MGKIEHVTSPLEIVSEWSAKLEMAEDCLEYIKEGVVLEIVGDGCWVLTKNGCKQMQDVQNPDCTISMSVQTMQAIYSGRLNPQQAYMEKEISVVGSLKSALYFSSMCIS